MSKEKKYRFYYSRKQNAVDEDMWGFTPRYTFVKTPDGYKQYSELCSIKGARCNWEDAELVYETDKMPEIVVHEAIPELIAELQHRLSNCIEPKFKPHNDLFVIVGYKDEPKTVEQYYIDEIVVRGNGTLVEYRDIEKNAIIGQNNTLFATEEEAKAKLREIQNGN